MLETQERLSNGKYEQVEVYNPYKTKRELEKVFGRGEAYIRAMLDELDEFIGDCPQVYGNVSVHSQLNNSSRLYYNVYVVNHFIAHKVRLDLGVAVPFDYDEEVKRLKDQLELQRAWIEYESKYE